MMFNVTDTSVVSFSHFSNISKFTMWVLTDLLYVVEQNLTISYACVNHRHYIRHLIKDPFKNPYRDEGTLLEGTFRR